MITAKEAVEKAAAYLQSLVPMQAGRTPVVEEIERTGPNWSVTLSYAPVGTNPYGLPMVGVMPGPGKEYKVFVVKGEDGEILSMKIRRV
jgi:hypothetical protein